MLFTTVGAGRPAASRIVGATSITWWNWLRVVPLSVKAVGPVHDGSVAGAAPVRGNLLGPLIRRAHRVRPSHRVVVVGVRGAEVIDLGQQELGRLDVGHTVQRGHLVEATLRRALGRRAVVAEDVVDQRVVESPQVVDRINEATHFMVGLLEEAGVDLHLAGQHRLQLRRHVIPAGNLFMARGQFRVLGHHAQLLLLGKDLLALRHPSRRRTCPCTCPTTPWARDAAHGWRPARST